GSYRSMMLALVGPPPAAIGGKTLTLAGVAKKGTRVVRFSTAFDLGRDVIGIPVDSTIATSTGGKARVEVDLRIFISRVGFDALPVSASTQEVTTLDMSSQAYSAIYRGFVSTDAYGARWVL
ncbi:MAG: hypothetical protein KAI47_18745, partial [Deltaproteobacteria bacterium]|nr:hypothetical protein [Deltaproteobacteria bacterium]